MRGDTLVSMPSPPWTESISGLKCNEEYFRQRFVKDAPPMSECARVARRPLSWLGWIPGLSSNPLLDLLNKEVSHQHIIFDSSGDNIGYGPRGMFSEDVTRWPYRYEETCYDGSLMRRAIAWTDPPSWYLGLLSNCQSYVQRVLDRYVDLRAKVDDRTIR